MSTFKKVGSLTFITSFSIFICGVLTAYSSGSDYHFPHFFAQTFNDSNSFVLRFSKGYMHFSKKTVAFQLIKPDLNQDTINPEERMKVKGETENVELHFANANDVCPYGSEPLASK